MRNLLTSWELLASQEGFYSVALVFLDGQWGDKRSWLNHSRHSPKFKNDHVWMYLSTGASLIQLHNICAQFTVIHWCYRPMQPIVSWTLCLQSLCFQSDLQPWQCSWLWLRPFLHTQLIFCSTYFDRISSWACLLLSNLCTGLGYCSLFNNLINVGMSKSSYTWWHSWL
jgi:hypothetical protein